MVWTYGLLLGWCALLPEADPIAHLYSHDIYYPHRGFPKLTTPQWCGELGVDAVVVLAIDDMRDSARYETFLRPILQRLKAIDGRAAVSIMSCVVTPDDPRLSAWLQEGVSLEAHTFDHPCPLLQGSLSRATETYHRCLDLLGGVPGNRPVAFRTPCCDSLNTVSPRFYRQIFARPSSTGLRLHLDSSVFQVFTAADPELPREWVLDEQGQERFVSYFPRELRRGNVIHDRFCNIIENYPYPYLMDGICWQFPCMTPSDWQAQQRFQPADPRTLRDWKIALDLTVIKQGVFNLVFHPYGWSSPEQIVSFIDYAQERYGSRVKFLTFREAWLRLQRSLLRAEGVPEGASSEWALIDVNRDGYLDVLFGERLRIWNPAMRQWEEVPATGWDPHRPWTLWNPWGRPRLPDPPGVQQARHVWVKDIDGDGQVECVQLSTPPMQNEEQPASILKVWTWDGREGWRPCKWSWPEHLQKLPAIAPAALRWVDVDEDGRFDLIYSDATYYGVWLFDQAGLGWTIALREGFRQASHEEALPPIIRPDGSDGGFFVRQRALHWITEETADRPNLSWTITFDELLGNRWPQGKTPRAALQAIQVKPGFVVDLVASEPLVADPVAFAWGADGKLWVVEMRDYPQGIDGRGQRGGVIRYLEDTDGDGRYDSSTLFLEGLAYPNGIHPWRDGVLISAAPDLLFAADRDGDGRAEVREVLFSGFVTGNPQHRVNGFTYGLDGWLYVANGDSGGEIVSLKTGQRIALHGLDLRINPDTGEMQALSGQTQFVRSRNDGGDWFGNNNTRPMWQYVMEDYELKRNPYYTPVAWREDVSLQPGSAPVYPVSRTLERFNDYHTANRFTSACSAIVFRDSWWGGEFTENCFVSEPVHNLIHREIMFLDRGIWKSRRDESESHSEFLASRDNWFRPTQIRTGPDGALWIADMYRLVIEHPQWIPIEWQEKLDLRAGAGLGRIWRVYPQKTGLRQIPRMDRMDSRELVRMLESANGWLRDMAQQLLIERADPEVHHELQRLLWESPHPVARIHALCTLGCLRALTTELLQRALQDEDPRIRRWGLRWLRDEHLVDQQLVTRLQQLCDDPAETVRRQLAITLGELKSLDQGLRGAWLAQLLMREGDDGHMRNAVFTSLDAENVGPWARRLIQQAAAELPAHARSTIPLVIEQALAWRRPADVIPSLLSRWQHPLVDWTEQDRLWSLSCLRVARRYQLALWAWDETVAAKAAGWPDELLDQAAQVAVVFKSRLKEIQELVSRSEHDLAWRVWGYQMLREAPWEDAAFLEHLADLLQPQQPPTILRAALEILEQRDLPQAWELILSRWRQLTPQGRSLVRETLLRRADGCEALLAALTRGDLTSQDVDLMTRQALLEHSLPSIRSKAERLFDNERAQRSDVILKYRQALTHPGDPQQGQTLFVKVCSACHRLGEIGHAVGPDLLSLKDRSPEYLITSILDPNRAVETRYQAYTVVTRDGLSYTGIIDQETSTSLSLLMTDGKRMSWLREEIDEIRASQKSLMPEGLERELSPLQLADLMAFIRAQQPGPSYKTLPGNHPCVVSAGEQGEYVLLPETAEIYGPSLVIEAQHGNLGWWSSVDDRVVWTIEVPEPRRYRVTIEWACDPQAAGHTLVIEGGRQPLKYRVQATSSWNDYQRRDIGELELSAGFTRLCFRPSNRPLPALMDLRRVELIPTQK